MALATVVRFFVYTSLFIVWAFAESEMLRWCTFLQKVVRVKQHSCRVANWTYIPKSRQQNLPASRMLSSSDRRNELEWFYHSTEFHTLFWCSLPDSISVAVPFEFADISLPKGNWVILQKSYDNYYFLFLFAAWLCEVSKGFSFDFNGEHWVSLKS